MISRREREEERETGSPYERYLSTAGDNDYGGRTGVLHHLVQGKEGIYRQGRVRLVARDS